jgi:hypothetical protein
LSCEVAVFLRVSLLLVGFNMGFHDMLTPFNRKHIVNEFFALIKKPAFIGQDFPIRCDAKNPCFPRCI